MATNGLRAAPRCRESRCPRVLDGVDATAPRLRWLNDRCKSDVQLCLMIETGRALTGPTVRNHHRLARRATVPGKRDDHPPLWVVGSGPRARRVAPTRPDAAWAERRRDTRGAARLPSGMGGAADNSGVERAASPAGLQADPRPVRIVDRSTRQCRNRPLIALHGELCSALEGLPG